jgi:PadR family transcriptional regulator, regulatory protein PadR
MVLRTLDVLGPLHGHGVARRIEQISDDRLFVNQGKLYPVLLRLEHERLLPIRGLQKTTVGHVSID